MATFRTRVNEIVAGVSVGIYIIVVPLLIPALWNRPLDQHQALARWCIAVLIALWIFVISNLFVTVIRVRRGHFQSGGVAWLASAILSLSSFLLPSIASAATPNHQATSQHFEIGAAVGLPLALVAKKRRDELLQLRQFMPDDSIDTAIHDLQKRNDDFLHALRSEIGERSSGVIELDDHACAQDASLQQPVVALPIGRSGTRWQISFAAVGSRLTVPDAMSRADLEAGLVALHHRGGVVIGDDLISTLRLLVLREHEGVVVVHAGVEPLDAEIAAQCVTASCQPATESHVMVRLLQPEATVEGLERPFDADLRRKCIEMLSYLAVHPDYGVSGDRLRARVLGSRGLDASVRTLNNTASALRRSLGGDAFGPRLPPVGPNGLYRTRSVTSDVTEFLALVERARTCESTQQRDLLFRAVSLVKGEPLTAEPRGYEWFLAEGHYARVLRALEFAVATLLDLNSEDRDAQWRARDAIGRFDPFHVLSEHHDDAERRSAP